MMLRLKDRVIRALPQWAAVMMLGACYTLFDAPFWDSLIQSSLGIEKNGPYLQMLVTSAEVGNLFIFVPALLADRYPPAYVAIGGAALVIIGYGVLGYGLVSITDSSKFEVISTVFTYSWGAGWIYAAAFVTIASNIKAEARGQALGTGLAAFYFASAWWTEVTEYCCTGHTTFEKSAWRHMPIAGTAILCSFGLYKSEKVYTGITKCSVGDAGLDKMWCGYLVLLGFHTYQWVVTGGAGSRDLSNFTWGDVPFGFMVLYFVIVAFFCVVYARNVSLYGLTTVSSAFRGWETPFGKLNDEDKSQHGKTRYRALCVIVAVNIGVVQTVAYNWETIKYHYGGKTGHGTDVAQIYNICRVLGCLVIGKTIDRCANHAKILCGLTVALTVTQLMLAADWNTSWAQTPSGVSFLMYPFEEFPLGICAFSAGGLYSMIPVMELEWFGTSAIGRIHGTTLLCAICGQTIFYSALGNLVPFSTLLWIMTAACFGSCYLTYLITAKKLDQIQLTKFDETASLITPTLDKVEVTSSFEDKHP